MYCKYHLHSNNFFVYLFSLIKILQTNAGEGNQNVDESTKDDSEEEDDFEEKYDSEEEDDSDGFQKENTDLDDD